PVLGFVRSRRRRPLSRARGSAQGHVGPGGPRRHRPAHGTRAPSILERQRCEPSRRQTLHPPAPFGCFRAVPRRRGGRGQGSSGAARLRPTNDSPIVPPSRAHLSLRAGSQRPPCARLRGIHHLRCVSACRTFLRSRSTLAPHVRMPVLLSPSTSVRHRSFCIVV